MRPVWVMLATGCWDLGADALELGLGFRRVDEGEVDAASAWSVARRIVSSRPPGAQAPVRAMTIVPRAAGDQSPVAAAAIADGDALEIGLALESSPARRYRSATPQPPFVSEWLAAGGIVPWARARLAEREHATGVGG